MSRLVYNVPTMYGDHHVLKVRQALTGLSGVSQVLASAARRKVAVEYDEGSISPAAIAKALSDAGYVPDQAPAMPSSPKQSEDGSAWYAVIRRITKTEMKDREMSGDFRRY